MSTPSETILAFADRLRATRDDQPAHKETYESWVVFRVSTTVLGLPVTHVREILRLSDLTGVPNAPRPVVGVMNLRGHVLPVVDTHALLRLPRSISTESTRVLVFLLDGRAVGLMVDEVRGLERLQVESIVALPKAQPLARLARGRHAFGDSEPILLLEPEELFAGRDLALN